MRELKCQRSSGEMFRRSGQSVHDGFPFFVHVYKVLGTYCGGSTITCSRSDRFHPHTSTAVRTHNPVQTLLKQPDLFYVSSTKAKRD